MGLTRRSSGRGAEDRARNPVPEGGILWAMVGNPNVGKSSLFNSLTGLHQHTGNWTGKTVGCSVGAVRTHTWKMRGNAGDGKPGREAPLYLADLPGCYSLIPKTAEEEAALRFLRTQPLHGAVVVCDAGCLERCLLLCFQLAELLPRDRIILCVNLIDELEADGYTVNTEALRKASGFSAVTASAKTGRGKPELLRMIREASAPDTVPVTAAGADVTPGSEFADKAAICRAACVERLPSDSAAARRAEKNSWRERLDALIMGRRTAMPVAAVFLFLILWLTIRGANIPSRYLADLLDQVELLLKRLPLWEKLPAWVSGILIDGVFHTSAAVVSVMLPPMAVFFPLFTLLEDFGFLPRIAFNFDRCFHACRTCGKQALTMCMGFGCNAAGVTGCRIIDSPRERLIAVLTNSLVPCNGKFPTILLLCAVSLAYMRGDDAAGSPWTESLLSSLMAAGVIVICCAVTLGLSAALSATVLKGKPSSFLLELPPYRKPVIRQVLVRSLLDRTLFVLARAVSVAAPMGAVIWLLSNAVAADGRSLLEIGCTALDPVGEVLCLDGAILIALILSLPANELTVPILLMLYDAQTQTVDAKNLSVLLQTASLSGKSAWTCLSFLFLFVFHIPCSTTLITVYRETGRVRYVLWAAGLPLSVGIVLCLLCKGLSVIL